MDATSQILFELWHNSIILENMPDLYIYVKIYRYGYLQQITANDIASWDSLSDVASTRKAWSENPGKSR